MESDEVPMAMMCTPSPVVIQINDSSSDEEGNTPMSSPQHVALCHESECGTATGEPCPTSNSPNIVQTTDVQSEQSAGDSTATGSSSMESTSDSSDPTFSTPPEKADSAHSLIDDSSTHQAPAETISMPDLVSQLLSQEKQQSMAAPEAEVVQDSMGFQEPEGDKRDEMGLVPQPILTEQHLQPQVVGDDGQIGQSSLQSEHFEDFPSCPVQVVQSDGSIVVMTPVLPQTPTQQMIDTCIPLPDGQSDNAGVIVAPPLQQFSSDVSLPIETTGESDEGRPHMPKPVQYQPFPVPEQCPSVEQFEVYPGSCPSTPVFFMDCPTPPPYFQPSQQSSMEQIPFSVPGPTLADGITPTGQGDQFGIWPAQPAVFSVPSVESFPVYSPLPVPTFSTAMDFNNANVCNFPDVDQATPQYYDPEQQQQQQSESESTMPQTPVPMVYPMVYVSPAGLLTVLLQHDVAVEMTLDRTIRVVNHRHKSVAATTSRGNASCIYHSGAKIYQHGTTTEVDVFWDRKAKMTPESMQFAFGPATFELVPAGLKVTEPNFTDLSKDMSVSLLFSASGYGPHLVKNYEQMTERGRYKYLNDGGLLVYINGLKIHQSAQGDVTVTAGRKRIRVSPIYGSLYVDTHFVEMAVEMNWNIKVRRGSHRLHASFAGFILCDSNRECGFDAYRQVFCQPMRVQMRTIIWNEYPEEFDEDYWRPYWGNPHRSTSRRRYPSRRSSSRDFRSSQTERKSSSEGVYRVRSRSSERVQQPSERFRNTERTQSATNC